jgi:hypothetical protein
MEKLGLIALIGLLALVLNIFLGAWRVRLRKLSFLWFVAIHLSVPVIWWLRTSNSVSLWNIPLFVAMGIAGQILGGWLFAPRAAPAQATGAK